MKIYNYADVIGIATDETPVAYEEYGSYQGDFLAVTKTANELHIWKGGFGSCTGCDWLENERSHHDDDWILTKEKAEEFLESDKPFLSLSIETAKEMLKQGTIESIFPANTRVEIEKGNYEGGKINFTELIKEALKI